ncbi:MAG: LAGLIDADG family homing endonuclease [Patescibacteria group bacterium]|nr:LAGLIDADG family homing endonuclease [Patescibacteria group bacterium]
MAYILGFFMADGYVFSSKRGSNYFAIQIKDKELLFSIRSVIGSEHKISKRIHNKDKSIFYRLQIGSNEICEDLARLGIKERKTYRLKLPNNIPKKYFGDFVRGYFDGDGNVWTGFVHKNRKTQTFVIHTVFTSCSKDFLNSLHNNIQKEGILGGGISCKRSAFCLKYSVKDSLKLYNLMYNGLGNSLFLPRKKDRFEKFIKMRV